MAARKTTKTDSDEPKKNLPAKLSKEETPNDSFQENSLDALKARFGVAEEDESIRNEGFELAKTGGLIRRPKPEAVMQYAEAETAKISTEPDSELSKVFDSAKSEHDNDNVYFSDLELKKEKPKSEPKAETEAPAPEAAEKPKRRPGRPRKVPVVEEPIPEEKPDSDEEITTIVKKYNTHTKVIFVDESLDDGIKRNSESELEELFADNEKGRKSKLWSRRKK